MAKGKSTFYSVEGKYPLNVTRYSNAELFCEDAQDTAWCRKDFFNEFVSPLLKFGEVYILNDAAAPEKKSKILIVRSPDHVRMFDSVGITQTDFPSYTPGPVEELITTKPDNFKNKVKLFITGGADSEIFDDLPHLSNFIYREPLGESILVFDYEDDKDIIYNIFRYDEDDTWTIDCALQDNDLLCELENTDYYIEESYVNGYGILSSYFPDGSQAKEFAKKIYLEIKPDFDFGEEDSKKVNRIIDSFASDEIYDFFSAYVYYYDRSSFKAIARAINKELAQIKEDTGFVLDPINSTITTTLGNLYYYLVSNGLTHLPLETALTKLSENYKSVRGFGGWGDAKYDLATDEFMDWNGFEQRAMHELEAIKNKMDIRNFDTLRDIFLKFDFQVSRIRPNIHPKTKNRFFIKDVDTQAETVKLSNESWGGKLWDMTFEEFKDWLDDDNAVLESKSILLSLQQILEDDSRKNRAPKVGIVRSNSNSSGRKAR